MENSVTPCEYARQRHSDLARWRNLWTILLFVFGSSLILFLSIAVLFFLRQSWLPGALSTLGTLVGGVSVKWVLDRRGEAVTEEEAAYKDVEAKCSDPSAVKAATSLRESLKLFGMVH